MKTIALLAIFFASAASAQSLDWAHVEPVSNGVDYDTYLTTINAPRVDKITNCEAGAGGCAQWAQVGEKQYFVTESSKLVAKARYVNRSYALIKTGLLDGAFHTVAPAGRHYIGSSRGRTMHINHGDVEACVNNQNSAVSITSGGEPLCATNDTLWVGYTPYKLPIKAVSKVFGTSYQGDWGFAFVGDDLNVYATNNGATFYKAGASLKKKSDLSGILSVYPANSSTLLVAVYSYQNKRNKSLLLLDITKNSKPFVLSNSVKTDLGIKPEVYVKVDGEIVVRSLTSKGARYFNFTLESLYAQTTKPENHYNEDDAVEFSLAAGVRQTAWYTKQEVHAPSWGGRVGDSMATVKYRMNESVQQQYAVSARYRNTYAGLSYAFGEAIGAGGASQIEREGGSNLLGFVGLDDVFSGAAGLRLEYEQASTSGVATYHQDGESKSINFDTKHQRFGVLRTSEQGGYMGLAYSENNMPMAVAYLDRTLKKAYMSFDENVRIQKYMFVAGYDSAQYEARYNFDVNKVYMSGRFGMGAYKYDLSDENTQAAMEALGASRLDASWSFAMDGSIEIGYMYQRRSLSAGGLGVNLQAGYSADIDWYYNDVDHSRNKGDSNKMSASFDRWDVRHGPFLRGSILF